MARAALLDYVFLFQVFLFISRQFRQVPVCLFLHICYLLTAFLHISVITDILRGITTIEKKSEDIKQYGRLALEVPAPTVIS